MKWLRAIAAVALGYLVSQGFNAGFVYFWYFGERSASTLILAVLTILFFALVGLGSGWLTGRLAGPTAKIAGVALAALIIVVTIGNIVADVAAEPLWHKVLVIVVMAPLVVWAATRVAKAEPTVKPTSGQ